VSRAAISRRWRRHSGLRALEAQTFLSALHGQARMPAPPPRQRCLPHHLSWVLAGCLRVPDPPAAAGGETPPPAARTGETAFFLTTLMGRPVSMTREVTEPAEFDGRPAIRIISSERMRLRVDGMLREIRVEREALLRPDGGLVWLEQLEREGGQEKRLRVEVGEGRVTFRSRLGRKGREHVRRVAHSGWFGLDLDGRVLAARGLLVDGAECTVRVVATVERGVASLTARVAAAAAGGPEGARFRVAVANTIRPETGWTLLLTSEGRTLERHVAGMVTRRVSESEAVLPREAARISNRIPVTGRLPRASKVRLVRLAVEFDAEQRRDLFPENSYQSVEWAGKRCILTLRPTPADGSLPDAELSPEERASYLRPTLLVQSDSPEVVRSAREITGGEGPSLRAAYKLCGWVANRLRGGKSGVSQESALRALHTGYGDCTEHAAVYAALARAAGIPCRMVVGLVYHRGEFCFHAWNEVHAGGRWVPLDATFNRFGLPPLYISFGSERPSGSGGGSDVETRALSVRSWCRRFRVLSVEPAGKATE